MLNNSNMLKNKDQNKLQDQVEKICLKFDLKNFIPFKNLSNNYVGHALKENKKVVLKIGKTNAIQEEAKALKAFSGHGCVHLLDSADSALLLEYIPGTTLKELFPQEEKYIGNVIAVMHKLHAAQYNPALFPKVEDWLEPLKEHRDVLELLQTQGPQLLLHGDLHHDNLLLNKETNSLIAIDPKGVIGEVSYEIAAFIRNPMPELLAHANCQQIILNRIKQFSAQLQLDPIRIKKWSFVQSLLAAHWAREDGQDPTNWETMAQFIANISID